MATDVLALVGEQSDRFGRFEVRRLPGTQVEVGVQLDERVRAEVEQFELEQIHQEPVGVEEQVLQELADAREQNGQAGADYMHSPVDEVH